jgi:hypothetical protein
VYAPRYAGWLHRNPSSSAVIGLGAVTKREALLPAAWAARIRTASALRAE